MIIIKIFETKNYHSDIVIFHKFRDISDGLSCIEFNVNFDWYKDDHNPHFSIFFALFNITIFEFTICNIHHVKD